MLQGLCRLPGKDVMMEDIRQRQRAREHQLPTLRHTMEELWLAYLDELAKDIGCKPNIGGWVLAGNDVPLFSYGICFINYSYSRRSA